MRMRILLVSFLAPLLLFAQSSPATAVDLFGDNVCSGQAANSPACQQAAGEGGSNNRVTGTKSIINTAVNIIAVVAGIASVIMILISSFMFVTAGGATPGQRSGDPNRIKKARATLLGAIIGLVVIALSWTITRFIVDRVVQ